LNTSGCGIDGFGTVSNILTEARADAVNAKATHPPKSPGIATEWNMERPNGPLKKYGFAVPANDPDREYCTGYNHGLILAESVMEEPTL